MKKHYENYEPTITTLKRKYEAATREKSLISIERDRLKQSLKMLQSSIQDGPESMETIKGDLQHLGSAQLGWNADALWA
jgi:hypothetical protein